MKTIYRAEHKGWVCGGCLTVLVALLAVANLWMGSVDIPAEAVGHILLGWEVDNEAWAFIVRESRVPLCVTALLLAMYAVLFAIVHIEAYALLVGTILLVIMLGIIMFVTRKLNTQSNQL